MHTCARSHCQALILLWARRPFNLPPLSGLTSEALPLGFQNIQRPGAGLYFHSSRRARLQKECFPHLPNTVPLHRMQTVSQRQPGDGALLRGPGARTHL